MADQISATRWYTNIRSIFANYNPRQYFGTVESVRYQRSLCVDEDMQTDFIWKVPQIWGRDDIFQISSDPKFSKFGRKRINQ